MKSTKRAERLGISEYFPITETAAPAFYTESVFWKGVSRPLIGHRCAERRASCSVSHAAARLLHPSSRMATLSEYFQNTLSSHAPFTRPAGLRSCPCPTAQHHHAACGARTHATI